MRRLLCDNMAEAFFVVEVLLDDHGQPQDGVVREVNAAFERETGLVAAASRRLSELSPGLEQPWIQALGPVALGGTAIRFEQRSQQPGRWYEVCAFHWGATGEPLVGVVFSDITQRKLDELMAHSIVEYAIILLDTAGHVRSWNAGAERIKGYMHDEIMGQHFSIFYTAEDIADGRPGQVLELAALSGRFVDEGWRQRRDGSHFWASVAVTPMRDSDGSLQGYCKVTRDLSERKRAENALKSEVRERVLAQDRLCDLIGNLEAVVSARTLELIRANAELVDAKERLQHLSTCLISAQEQERGRIARELHDGTGQLLTLLQMQLAEMSQAEAAVASCSDLAKQAIDHTRRLALNLRPAVLDDLGLDAALEWMLGQQAQVTRWSATYHGGIGERRFAGDIETACFRIAQEALTNAARYAHAAEVSVSLATQGERLVLVVADNGCGFDVQRYQSQQERTRHFGLMSMQERAGLVGAQLSIDSAPERGTRVTATFPVEPG